MRNLIKASWVLAALLPLSALSESNDTLSMDQLLEMPLAELVALEVTTASKTTRLSSEITQKVDVITQQQFSRAVSNNRNIAEIIQYLPGASVKVLARNYPNWGAYGGIGPKYTTYMIQGLPVDAFLDPMNIEPMAIQKIEIQRGPASVLYPNYLSQDFAGNQSPLAGTVNLIFKEKVSGPSTMVSLGYGSHNTYTGRARHENRIKGMHLLGGISFEQSDYADYGSADSWLNIRKDPEYKKGKAFAGANLNLDKSKKHNITLFGNQVFHTGDEGRDYRGYDHSYSLINAGYAGKLKDNLKIALKTGMRWYNREWQSDDSLFALEDTKGVKQLIVPIDFSVTHNHFNKSNLTIGADYQGADYVTWRKPVEGKQITGDDANVSQIGVYGQEELQFYKIILRAGARLNHIGYKIDKIGGKPPETEKETWNILLWSAGIKVRLTEDFTLYSNGGSSFLSPGFKSIFGTIPANLKNNPGSNGQLPNPDLDPENGIGLDLGFDYALPVNVSLSTRVFHTEITDAIIDNVISEDPSQTMSINAKGETIAKGFEFCVKQHLENKIEWFANTTYTHSEITDPDSADLNGNEVPFVPEIMTNLGATFYLPAGIEVSPWIHFGGRIYDSNSKSGRKAFESKELLNANMSKAFSFPNDKKMDVFIKAYNLTNNRFDMPWQFKDPGFTLSLGFRLSF